MARVSVMPLIRKCGGCHPVSLFRDKGSGRDCTLVVIFFRLEGEEQ